MSNFDTVKEWSRVTGTKTLPSPGFPSDDLGIKLGVDLITEEVDELKDAVACSDIVEVADAIGDILYVVYGFADRFGIDADRILDAVHTSNMSKFCSDMAEADETMEREKMKGVHTLCKQVGNKIIILNADTHKIIKGVAYVGPDIIGVLNDQTDKANQSNTDKEMGQTI